MVKKSLSLHEMILLLVLYAVAINDTKIYKGVLKMLEQFLLTFLGLLVIVGIPGLIIRSMVYEKINTYLGIVLLITFISAILTGMDYQAKSSAQHSQVKTP